MQPAAWMERWKDCTFVIRCILWDRFICIPIAKCILWEGNSHSGRESIDSLSYEDGFFSASFRKILLDHLKSISGEVTDVFLKPSGVPAGEDLTQGLHGDVELSGHFCIRDIVFTELSYSLTSVPTVRHKTYDHALLTPLTLRQTFSLGLGIASFR